MLAKPLQVGGVDNLDMLDAPTLVALICRRQFLDCADNLGIGRITNGVDCGLEPVHRRPDHEVADFRACQKLQSGLSRCIRIWFFQPCASAAQSAVKIKLHTTKPQLVIIQPWAWPRSGDGNHIVDASGITKYADRQPAGIACTAIALPVVHGGAHIGNRRDPHGVEFFLSLAQRDVALKRFGGRYKFADQICRGVHKYTAWLPSNQFDPSA